MMAFQSLCISFIFIIFLSTSIDALRYRSLRQTRADECPNLTVDACLFVGGCENGGQCIQDVTTADCYQCICPAGYTGKRCETSTGVIPTGCNPGCQNGGLCNINVCICLAGYTGTFCETRDFCLPNNPCQNGGRCISTSTTYQCDCTSTGYTGPICTDVIITDPCTSNPCQNGGICSWDGTTTNCICINGYTGAFCQIAPISCVTIPCQNGGICELLSTNTYGCVCPEEFTGAQCETSILVNHPCVTTPNLCLNGGTCTVNGANYLCKCAAGWSGTNCQIKEATSSCDLNPCGIHGSCVQAVLSPTETVAYCNCENLWTGRYCDVNMNADCPAGYCVNGVCRMVGNVPYCDCPPLYTGQRCDTLIGVVTTPIPNVKPCSSNPCLNSGICYNNGNDFVCVCSSSWTGARCEIFQNVIVPTTPSTGVSPCTPNPCLNSGTCYENGNAFLCACQTGWTGTRCESSQSVTPSPGIKCANTPCRNGGSCFDTVNSYVCVCTNIYTGVNCETVIPAINNCPLNCSPGYCTLSGSTITPYVCMCNGTIKLNNCISK